MACHQKIAWQLKKEELLKMLDAAAGNYTALEFSMCIEDQGVTQYYMTLVNSGSGSEAAMTTTTAPPPSGKPCPVPPDCN